MQVRQPMTDQQDGWPADWLRGVLELGVLAVLVEEPLHGYAVIQRLQDAGLGDISAGTLYPLMNRLERDGLVTSAWVPGEDGPGRKVVTITDDGTSTLVRRRARWEQFTHATTRLLASPDAATPRATTTPTTTPEKAAT